MTKSKNARKSASRASASIAPVVETPVVETPVVATAPVVETPVVETPAPVATAEPTPAPAPETEKVTWADTMKKAQASFAKTGAFREGTNRAILFPLLDREEGLSLAEAAAATLARGGKSRNLSSIHTDLHDIAKITQRKLIRADKGDQKRYRLAPLAPLAPVKMEEVK
jgi:hypothetical protein